MTDNEIQDLINEHISMRFIDSDEIATTLWSHLWSQLMDQLWYQLNGQLWFSEKTVNQLRIELKKGLLND